MRYKTIHRCYHCKKVKIQRLGEKPSFPKGWAETNNINHSRVAVRVVLLMDSSLPSCQLRIPGAIKKMLFNCHRPRSNIPLHNLIKIQFSYPCSVWSGSLFHNYCTKRVARPSNIADQETKYAAFRTAQFRTTSNRSDVKIILVCAKNKVAAFKSLTIPQMELCSALVLAQLLTKVQESIDVEMDNC